MPTSPSSPMQHVLHLHDFRLLWLGQATSLLGDQFYMVAGPWLVLKLTGDPLALGAVLAVGAIPRAVVMLLGGAITDRLSPRRIMLASDVIRLFWFLVMFILVGTGQIQVWMLYLSSFIGGILSGLFIPASSSIIPTLVPQEDLQAGNSIFQGSSQLIGFIGPALAGLVIGAFGGGMQAIALAYGIDVVSFIASVVTLWLMRSQTYRVCRQVKGKRLAVNWDRFALRLERWFPAPGIYLDRFCQPVLRRTAPGRHPGTGQPAPARRRRRLRVDPGGLRRRKFAGNYPIWRAAQAFA